VTGIIVRERYREVRHTLDLVKMETEMQGCGFKPRDAQSHETWEWQKRILDESLRR
jgi:hypothetical protein